MFFQALPAGSKALFKARLQSRMRELAAESGLDEFTMPVALVLVVDEANGGDVTAQELVRRFNLLDFESRNLVDFYFLGWLPVDPRDRRRGIRFDLDDFESCRAALREVGLKPFGGNADLILLDARYRSARVGLDFSSAIRIDLSAGKAADHFPTLGGFLQAIIEALEEIRPGDLPAGGDAGVADLSDRLGLGIAKQSLLEFVLEKWGKVIGAGKLASLAVRDLGPEVNLAAF